MAGDCAEVDIDVDRAQRASPRIESSADIDCALNRAGFTRFTLRVCALCGFGWFADGVEYAVLSYMLPTLEDYWDLSSTHLATLAATVALGQAAGAVFWGTVSDSCGRRRAYLGSLLTASTFAAASAFAPSFAAYCLLRAATGFGIGGNLPVSIALAAEFLPSSTRATAIVLMHVFYEAGELLTTGLAAAFLLSQWRLFLLVTAAPAVAMAAFSLAGLPESPHWFLSKGETERAQHVLGRAAQSRQLGWCERAAPPDDAKEAELGDETGFLQTSSDPASSQTKSGIRSLATRALAPTTAAVVSLWFFAQLGSGWVVWCVEIADIRGVPSGPVYISVAVARVLATTAFLFASKAIQGPGPFRFLTFALLLTMGASAAFAVLVGDHRLTSAWTFGVGYVTYVFFFGMTWPVMYAIAPMSFPTCARGAGFGVANFASKFGSVLHPFIAGGLIHRSIFTLGAIWTSGWLVAAVANTVLSRRPTYI